MKTETHSENVDPIGYQASCNYEIVNIHPNFDAFALNVVADCIQSPSVVLEEHSISFTLLALYMCPESNGKIDAGYHVHRYDNDEGPYKEWCEVEMSPKEFLKEVYGQDTEYNLDADLRKAYMIQVEEAVHRILNERLLNKPY